MKQEHTSTKLTRKWLSIIKYLLNKSNPYLLNVIYKTFSVHQKVGKKLNYYLLQWVQAWKIMLFTTTLNKWQMRNEIRATINLITYRRVAQK